MYPKIKALRTQFITFIVLIASTLSAQPTLVKKWDKSFGGVYEERFKKILLMPDGGYLLAGESSSIASGNKSQTVYDTVTYQPDIWIVRMDSNGNKLWDKQFGGSSASYLSDIIVLNSGDILLGASSRSEIANDLSVHPLYGNLYYDCWVLLLDEAGNKKWDNRYGGNRDDVISKMIELDNGTIAITGYTNSDTSKFISTFNRDSTLSSSDFWIFFLDLQGNYIKDFRIGGTNNDYTRAVIKTSDRGFLIAGESYSGIGGDKSSDRKLSTSGFDDIWVVKIDSQGFVQWDKTYGGHYSEDIVELYQNNYGYSLLMSTNSFQADVTSTPISTDLTIFDIWLVEIDFNGNIVKQSRRGGAGGENARTLVVDSTITIMAITNSNISGDKSEVNMATNEMWLLSLDSLGNKLWDKTILTDGEYSINDGGMVMPSPNCYTLATHTTSGIAGDKSTPNFGMATRRDLWVIKYCFEEVSNVHELNERILRLFPKPTSSMLTIQTDAAWQEATVTLSNLEGKVVLSQALSNSQQQSIDIGHLPSGMYFVTVQSEQQKWVRRVVKVE